ncbi:MAG: D-aminoacylase [Patescibacteria group bacterium]
MFKIIIKNGTIIDGSGQPMYKADIGIKEDRIAAIGELHNEKCEIEIDAAELLVCPGIIDVNNHSDTYWQIFANPNLESLVYQGVTTIIGGNCGSSLAPLADAEAIESIQKWVNIKRVNLNWLSVEELFETIEQIGLSVNFVTLIGHGTLRRGIIKNEMRNLTPKELGYVEKMLDSSLRDGGIGMSTGLIYTHARLASTEELIALAKIVRKFNGIYTTHIRNEREKFLEAVEEALKIAEESGVKLHISHLKVMEKENWSLFEAALTAIEKAYERGVDVTFDVFPYTNTGTVLYTLLPEWVSAGGKKMLINRLKDSSIRAKVISEMKESGFDYSKIEIAISSLNRILSKRRILDIAKSQEKSVEDAIVDVLIASEGRVITSIESLSEENIEKAVAHPLSIISTNGAGYSIEHSKTGEVVHPRSFGTFPRIISQYVLGKRIISWEAAIRKMTGIPAQKFGIKKRGEIKEKNFADIMIINRDKLADLATAENPYQYSKGVEFVLVNGEIILSEGVYGGGKGGRILIR